MFVATAKELYQSDGIEQLSNHTISKWLCAKDGHRAKALQGLSETLAWRKSYNITSLMNESFEHQTETGKLHFFGHALDGSAIMIFNGARHISPKARIDVDVEVRFVIHVIETGIRSGYYRLISLIEDKITVIFDLNGMNNGKNDIKIASQLVPILQKHYPDRLSRFYLFPTNNVFLMAWMAFKYFIDAKTIPKLYLKESAAVLAEWVSRDQYFKKYGGLANDPFDFKLSMKSDKLPADSSNIVLKTASVERVLGEVEVEEFWAAPDEYQTI